MSGQFKGIRELLRLFGGEAAALDPAARARAWRRIYILVALTIASIHLLGLFASGPWDPWETHYGEVARNILGRDDPMDLWWRPGFGPDGKKEQSFASKHALPFWAMALSMKLFGVGTGKDPAEMVQPYWPELALRLPNILVSFATIAFLAFVTRRMIGRRAAVFVALAVGTLPQLAIVGRQAITDIYFIGPVAFAMGAWVLAWHDTGPPLQRRRRGRLSVPRDPLWWAFVVAFLVFGLAPVAVLQEHVFSERTISRVSTWSKRPTIPNVDDLREVGLQLMIYWIFGAAILLRAWRWTQRRQVWMGIVFLAAGLALMGKGLIGPGVIGLLILVDLVVTGRWSRLWGAQLVLGTLIFVVVCFPWHHAMALFREDRWVQELLIDNNLTRFAAGEQKQAVGSFAFYIQTLGLAGLPWVAALPAVLWAAVRRVPRAGVDVLAERRRVWWRFCLMWFAVTLGVITYSATKYYHYLAPCLPPVGVLMGLWLDALWGRTSDRRTSEPEPSVAGRVVAFALGACIVFMVTRVLVLQPAWLAHLTTYLYTSMWTEGAPPTDIVRWLCVPFALGLLAWVASRRRAAVAAMCLSALLTTGWVFQSYVPAASEHWSQRTLFRTLYAQRGPDDPILSWWFYYRGESYFTKHRIWVTTEPRRDATQAFLDEHRGQGRTAWVVTTVDHAKKAAKYFPADMRDSMEQVYENAHYALIKAPIP